MEPERSLEQRVAAVESLVRTILARLEEIEPEPSTARPDARPPTATPLRAPAPSSRALTDRHAAAREHRPQLRRLPPRLAWVMKPGETLEDLLGGRILAAVGGLAILIGVVLFLVIAVDRGWIGVEARVALAFMGSTLLLGVGLFLYERRGQTDAAVAAVATALASLYASLTYATAVQDVIGRSRACSSRGSLARPERPSPFAGNRSSSRRSGSSARWRRPFSSTAGPRPLRSRSR